MVALRTALEIVKSLCYKLRIMGVDVLGPVIVLGYNDSVVKGAHIPHHKLLKKNLGICYRSVREAFLAGIWKFGF